LALAKPANMLDTPAWKAACFLWCSAYKVGNLLMAATVAAGMFLRSHACTLHSWNGVTRRGQAIPPLAGATNTLRVANCTPPPQALVHLEKDDQWLTRQSTAQAAALHVCVASRAGHAAPPLDAGVSTLRDCVDLPPPHVAEHGDHVDQALTLQSTGHGQACDCDKLGHAAPPLAGCVMMVRVCVCDTPQALGHTDHADHSLTLQLTGQPCVLHAWDLAGFVPAVSDSSQFASLPSEHETERVCTPPPHVLLHADHTPVTQLGHRCVLHA